MKRLLQILALVLLMGTTTAQDGYQRPPAAIERLALAKPTPIVSISPDGNSMLLLQRNGYQSLAELAKPELRIAGLRINPANHGSSRARPYHHIAIQEIGEEEAKPFQGMPENALIDNISWSPDSKHIAFSIDEGNGLSLWIASLESMVAIRHTEAVLNDAMGGSPMRWINARGLLYKRTSTEMQKPAVSDELPDGPVIQESSGNKSAIRTYQDLLANQADEALFEYYATSVLMHLDLKSSAHKKLLNKEGMITQFSASPDDQYLLVTTLHRPFSYLVPYYRFPLKYAVYGADGRLVKGIADIPLAENIPQGFDAVREGPRSIGWRDDAQATLFWVEAVDGGDPKQEIEYRDQMYSLEAPFTSEKQQEITLKLRYGGIIFGDNQNAIVNERMWSTRQIITSHFTPGDPDSKHVLFDRSSEDRYNDPGSFVTVRNAMGQDVLAMTEYGEALMSGRGSSPQGDRPFVRKLSFDTGESTELWRSKAPKYEVPISFVHVAQGKLITRQEGKEEQPNYYMTDLKSGKSTKITDFEHPYPDLLGVTKQEVKYKRADGVDLSGDLYLPKGYDASRDGPLPTLIWAYPREYKSAAAAGQISGSPYSFTRVSYGSPIFWVARGYAVLNNASMPVVGEGDAEPNDSFRKQLVMNAEAAIDELVDMGVCDPDRVGVGGHSYGAFMTANLLAHSDLFAAGIARSGAYNRTLTPFGFQREERTYWDDPELYYTMSPFMHADKVNEPLLMIHGEADNNSGTFPMQSKRFYSAVKGLGGTVRLVMLPYESHGYRAEENILHMLYEQDAWLDKYVKNKSKTQASKSD